MRRANRTTRNILLPLAILLFTNTASPQYTPVIHKFEAWNLMSSGGKEDLFLGFTNGFFYAREDFAPLAHCLRNKVSTDQAVALINKFYSANSEKWNVTLAKGILLALTVKDGPCPEILKPTEM